MRHNDQRYLLAGAALCFAAGIILALIRGCDSTVVGMAVGAGAAAIGGMSGIARGSKPDDPKQPQ